MKPAPKSQKTLDPIKSQNPPFEASKFFNASKFYKAPKSY